MTPKQPLNAAESIPEPTKQTAFKNAPVGFPKTQPKTIITVPIIPRAIKGSLILPHIFAEEKPDIMPEIISVKSAESKIPSRGFSSPNTIKEEITDIPTIKKRNIKQSTGIKKGPFLKFFHDFNFSIKKASE